MNIAVIGGSGFIGSRLCARLDKAQKAFFILDKNPSPFFVSNWIKADVRSIEDLRAALCGCDVVINLAAEHRDDVMPRSLYDEVNVEGARNIVQVCLEKRIQSILFTSSVAVYGFAPPDTDESGEIHYFNDYGRTKWEAEKIYRVWFDEDPQHRSLTILRPTVVFGERNRGNVYNLLKQISSGLFPMVGSGNNSKSMAYVENVAAFLEYWLDVSSGLRVFNYIDKPDFTMNELVRVVKSQLGKKSGINFHWPYWLGYVGGLVFDMLASLTGKKFSISRIRIKKFCATTKFDTSIPNKTDFKAPVSLEDGLRRTIQYEFMQKSDRDSVLFYTE